jgi:hypothetical protein
MSVAKVARWLLRGRKLRLEEVSLVVEESLHSTGGTSYHSRCIEAGREREEAFRKEENG